MDKALETPQPPLNLRKFLDEFIKINSYKVVDNVPLYIGSRSPVSVNVETSCSIDQISSLDDNLCFDFEPGVEVQRVNITHPDMDKYVPRTYALTTKHKETSRRSPFARTQYSYRLTAEPKPNDELDAMKPLHEFELKLTVRLYRPPRAAHRGFKLEQPVFAEEFLCLGSNYLSELRDKISCICNGRKFVDISDDPDAPLPVLDTDPGYFFIYNTFYNDTRNPQNCDYSQTILDWARTARGVQDETFDTKSMETTRFIDLTVSLGAPVQYLHHGNCEHLFVFSQVEVLKPQSISINRSLYPHVRSLNSFNRRSCFICGQRGYHFIVEKCIRQIYDPSYLCRTCFFRFHYVDGKKVGEFQAYRIYDHTEDPNDEKAPDKLEQDSSSDGEQV